MIREAVSVGVFLLQVTEISLKLLCAQTRMLCQCNYDNILNKHNALLPQGLCTCCPLCQNAFLPDISRDLPFTSLDLYQIHLNLKINLTNTLYAFLLLYCFIFLYNIYHHLTRYFYY